jgi:hypothetical protein
MSVKVTLEGHVLVVRLDGQVTVEDVERIAGRLVEGAAQQQTKLSVLGIVRGLPRMPSREARRAMRGHRNAIRNACAEVHVVLESGGWLAAAGLRLASSLRASAERVRVHFHASERAARLALEPNSVAAVAST